MSIMSQRLSAGMSKILTRGGTPIRVQYFTSISEDETFDDSIVLIQSGGDLWTSGIIFPLSNQTGHSDSLLVEQGKLINGDTKLFLHGSLLLTGSELNIKITVGSPASGDTNYSIIPPGPISQSISNIPIYKIVYIRKIGGVGSLLNEQWQTE